MSNGAKGLTLQKEMKIFFHSKIVYFLKKTEIIYIHKVKRFYGRASPISPLDTTWSS